MWMGFARHGICAEAAMPSLPGFDPQCAPDPKVTKETERVRELGLQQHYAYARAYMNDALWIEVAAAPGSPR
jgi:hypothetical protein